MGRVAKQSFFSTISAYLGVLVGYLNIVILMPKFMTPEQVGLFRTINAIAMLIVPLVFFGSGSAIMRFRPKYNDRLPEFLTFLLTVIFTVFGLILILFTTFKETLFGFYEEKAPEVNDYFSLISGLIILMVLYNYFAVISRSHYSIIIPSIMTDFVYKAFNSILIVLFGLGFYSFVWYLYGHFVAYVILCLIIGWLVIKNFNISFTLKNLLRVGFEKEVLNFMSFSFLSSFGIIMVLQIDQIMVSQMLGLSENGVYSTAMMMALVIEYPKKYLAQILHPYISQNMHDENFEELNKNYKSASNIMIWIGGFLFIAITLNLDSIFTIMPNGDTYARGFWVVYIVGATKLVDMLFSTNAEIMAVSKYFRYNVILTLGLGVITVISNLYLIPIFGMSGAAIATLISYLIFNTARFLILRIGLRLSPFSYRSIRILLFIALVYVAISFVPAFANPWVDLFARSALIGIFCVLSIFILRPSEELMAGLEKYKSLILDRLK